MNINANTGLVGGAVFEFGVLGVVFDPVMLVISFRLFEKVLMDADEEITMITALIYASLSINSWAIWSNCIRVSYVPLFIFSLFILVNRTDYKLDQEEIQKKKKILFSFGGRRGNNNKNS